METTRALGVIIGDGRLSGHIPKLFNFHSDQFVTLDRQQFSDFINQATENGSISLTSFLATQQGLQNAWKLNVYIAVNDDQILDVYQKLQNVFNDQEKAQIQCFHFSGALSFPKIIGIHPLMTFSKKLYADEFYASISLFCDDEAMAAKFPDRMTYLNPKDKVIYHSLCVMLGNFPQLLIQTIANRLPSKFKLSDFSPLILKSITNVLEQGKDGLTGPIVRKDVETIKKHQQVLAGTELGELYNILSTIFINEVDHV